MGRLYFPHRIFLNNNICIGYFIIKNVLGSPLITFVFDRNRDYYQSVFGYRQYHVLGINIVLCEPLASIIHYFLFPIHDTADTQRHEGNNLFII